MDDTRPIIPPPAYGPAPAPRRGPFPASVLAGALLLGAGGGVAGAAAWQEWGAGQPAAQQGSAMPTVRTGDQDDEPAPDGSVEQVAARVLPSVVRISVSGPQGSGAGSGIVLSADGEILTNEHVVAPAAEGGELFVSFEDGTRAAATVLGTDPLTDTAVIDVEDVDNLAPATIGRSGELDVGQEVVAIGSPFGLDSTVTSGIVSALDRPVNVGQDSEGNSTTYPAIQTDAAINPGNSGGPLVDMNGDVVGINSSIRTASSGGASGSIGLGFAIPIDEVLPIVEQMRNGEEPTHARLGITVSDAGALPGEVAGEAPETPTVPSTEGALVREVEPGSTANEAGLAEGDVITRIDDNMITGADSLVATVRSYRPDDEVTVTYVRDGETGTVTLELDSDGE